IVARQPRSDLAPFTDDRAHQRALLFLQLGHALFDRFRAQDSVSHDRPRLADAVRAVDRLSFRGRVPPWVEDEDVVGSRQVQPYATCLQAEQEHARPGWTLEAFDPLPAIVSLAVEVFVVDASLREPL